jgi:secreted trypsin-like serine protease
MHKRIVCMAAAAMAALALAPAPAADSVTPRRAIVRQWEAAALERAIGKDRAAALRASPHIVGGETAPAGKWPFQVALLDAHGGSNYNAQFCGGTLVGPLYVVTAAHCVHGETASDILVLTGTQSLASGGSRHKVAAIKKHPKYNNRTTDYDIAVIKLKTPAAGIKYATMIAASQESSLADAGTRGYVTGWGDRSDGNGSYPKTLQQVVVPIVSRSDCNDANSYDGAITARMICAGYRKGGRDSCSGDSGGPFVVKDRTGRYQLLAGIVSWGDGCAEPNFYGVYSRVAALSEWANTTIAGLGADELSASCENLRGRSQADCLDRATLAPAD